MAKQNDVKFKTNITSEKKIRSFFENFGWLRSLRVVSRIIKEWEKQQQ